VITGEVHEGRKIHASCSFTEPPGNYVQLPLLLRPICRSSIVRHGAVRSQVPPTVHELHEDVSRKRLEATVSFYDRLVFIVLVCGGHLWFGRRTTLPYCVCAWNRWWCGLVIGLAACRTQFVNELAEVLLGDWICGVVLEI